MIGATLSVLGCVVLAGTGFGLGRVLLHRARPVRGDPGLAAELGRLAGRRARRVAAVVIDLDASPAVRAAFIDAAMDTRFEIGSVTKGLTGMLLAQTIDRGEASLDTTLAALLPETAGRRCGSLTMRELCTHTSGLPRLPRSPITLARVIASAIFGVDPYRGTNPASVIAAARRSRLVSRGSYRYSNLGAAVLGHALARAANSAYSTMLAEGVFTPLGMAGSGTNLGGRVSRGWTVGGRRAWPWRAGGYEPAGSGVFCTPADIALLATSLLKGTAPGQAAIEAVIPAGPDTPNRSSGMFWVIDRHAASGGTMVWHNGQTGGYSTFLAIYPQARRAVAVLADTANARAQQRTALGLTRWLSNGGRHDEPPTHAD